MSILLVDEITQHIRRVDGGNKLSPHELGMELYYRFGNTGVVGFVERVNPDKRLGAGRLAELICAEFDLREVA
jgi:hypothetical protein